MPRGVYKDKSRYVGGKKGRHYKLSPETCERIRLSKIGHKVSEETRLKIGKGNYGKKRTIEVKQKMGISQSKRKGVLSANWRGGVSFEKKEYFRGLLEYKIWKIGVLKRYDWCCVSCKKRENIVVHHIVSFTHLLRSFNIKNRDEARKCKELWDLNNGIVLCEECHFLTENYGRPTTKKE